jgi:hypothetical protein
MLPGSKFGPVTFASRADWFGDHIWSSDEIPDLGSVANPALAMYSAFRS